VEQEHGHRDLHEQTDADRGGDDEPPEVVHAVEDDHPGVESVVGQPGDDRRRDAQKAQQTPADEAEATRLAQEALEEQEDPAKAEAILDRFDEVQEQAAAGPAEVDGEAEDETAGDGAAGDGDEAATEDEDDAGVFTSTTAGVVDSFTEEETTEDDIGGYYYDIAFILESLTSRAFRIGGLFMAVMALTFVYLYRGGIDDIRRAFVSQMPPGQQDLVRIVTLHPVEALIFEIKVATLLGLVATLPLLLYYAWPRLKERGLVGGDRRVLLVWGVTLEVGAHNLSDGLRAGIRFEIDLFWCLCPLIFNIVLLLFAHPFKDKSHKSSSFFRRGLIENRMWQSPP